MPRVSEISEEVSRFLDEHDVKAVVDAIVSVVSDTETKVEPHGASLYHDGTTFRHNVDCECMVCLFSEQRQNCPVARDVRRRLFVEEEDEEDSEDIFIPEDRRCHNCGMFESHSMRVNGSEFIETNEYPMRHLCEGCYDFEHLCQTCGQPNTWGIPCQCNGTLNLEGWYIDREGSSTYSEEYENEDPPENNTEKVKQVKKTVIEMGSLVDKIQEKLSDGEYLQLMDHLQKITNKVNSLQ